MKGLGRAKGVYKKYIWVMVLVAVLLAVDLIVKHIGARYLAIGNTVTVIPGFFSLHYTHNQGASFGIMPGQLWLFIVVTVSLLCLLAAIYYNTSLKTKRVFSVGYALVFAGALGNMVDRIILGYVRDFFKIHFFPAIFNVADAFILIGALIIVFYMVKYAVSEQIKITKEKRYAKQIENVNAEGSSIKCDVLYIATKTTVRQEKKYAKKLKDINNGE